MSLVALEPDSTSSIDRQALEILELRSELVRERLARELRGEVNTLAAKTSGELSRRGVAQVIADGASSIFSAGCAMVAYVVDEQMVQIVHGPTVHKQIAQNWGLVSIETPIPICDVLRGDQPYVEICNQSEFTPWVAATAGAAIANLSSMIVHPIGDPNQPDAVIAITWPTPHELDVLERELLELLLLRCAPALKRSERGDSHGDIAMKLQNWLLNTPFPEVDGVNVAALYEPGRDVHAVGGDWHDVVRISDTRTALVIGDVCGHDIEAAVAMSQVRHVLSTNLHVLADPVAALSMTDEYLRQRTPHPMATALITILEPGGVVTVASAGHPPPIACRPGSDARLLGCGLGPPLGSGLGRYTSRSTQIEPGTVLTCYTDGVVETRVESIDESIERLRLEIGRTLQATADHCPSAIDAVMSTLRSAVDTPLRTDDAAALVVHHLGASRHGTDAATTSATTSAINTNKEQFAC